MVMDIIIEEASTLRFPPGFWPTDMKCPECKANAHLLEYQEEEDVYNLRMRRM